MSDAPTSEPPAAFQAAFEEHLKREQEIVGMRYDDAPSVTDRGRAPGPLRHDPMEGKAFDAAKLAAAMADEQQEMQRRRGAHAVRAHGGRGGRRRRPQQDGRAGR